MNDANLDTETFDRRALMQHLSESLEGVHREIRELSRSVNYYRATQEESIDKAIEKAMLKAFPAGDAAGHRLEHEASIKAAEERTLMYRELRTSVAKWGVVGLLTWGSYHLWLALLAGPHK